MSKRDRTIEGNRPESDTKAEPSPEQPSRRHAAHGPASKTRSAAKTQRRSGPPKWTKERDGGNAARSSPARKQHKRKVGGPPRLRFTKMHGLGNDFMIVDLVRQPIAPSDLAERAEAWSNRRTGVGFDQLIAVLPPTAPDADFRSRIFNADGSEAENCGNGARCVARFVVDERLTPKRNLTLQQGGTGGTRTELLGGNRVLVELGVPSTEQRAVPFVGVGESLAHDIELKDQRVQVTPVAIGNPHAVIFTDDLASVDVEGIGAELQRHACFPSKVNVGFLETSSDCLGRLRVYERGVGETNACGSGAAAAMVAAQLHKRWGKQAEVKLRGGKLRVEWQGPGWPVRIEGPTQLVFKGQLRL